MNRDYRYEFFDDARVASFLKSEFEPRIYNAYEKLQIGAAKGDFFRYAVLLKHGGVYLDIDGAILRPLRFLIQDDDVALISKESAHDFFAQWALVFAKDHPFVHRALDLCVDNIENNRHPYHVHAMTGPTVFTEAVRSVLREHPNTPYRLIGPDWERKRLRVMIPKHFLNRIMYFRNEHWGKEQKKKSVLKSK